MKVFDMQYIDVSGDVYRRIITDESTSDFFDKLTKLSKEISKQDEESKEHEIKDIKPDLSIVSSKMNQLIQSGIDIDDKNWWLSEELYSFNSYLGNLSFDSSFLVMFLNVNFNGIKLDVNDFDYLGYRLNSPQEHKDGLLRITLPTPLKLLQDYSRWSQNNKKLDKKIEKAEKKYSSISDEAKKSVLRSQILFMKSNLERGNQMKQRIDFFDSVTTEQITLIYEIFDEVKKTKKKYDKNRETITAIMEKYKKLESTTYERAFIKLIEEGITQSEISSIIIKMFKTAFVRRFMSEDITLPNDTPSNYIPDIDINAVSWFINFKQEEFIKLNNEIFDNFDLFYECFEEKILKKK